MALATTMMESIGSLQRPAIGQDSVGGTTQAYGPVTGAQNIPCSVQPATASVILVYAQREQNVSVRIFLTQDIGARVNDKFLVVDNRTGVTRRYLVQGFAQNLLQRLQSPYFIDCQELL